MFKSYRDSLYKVNLVDGALSLDLRLEILVSPGGRVWQKRHFCFEFSA
jgi:hypothetical protein